MAQQARFWSRLGILGGVYAVLFVVVNVLFGSQPGTGATAATVVTFYDAHRTAQTAGVFVVIVAVVVLAFFLASLRRTLAGNGDGRHLANVVTAGGAVYSVGLVSMATLTMALVDAAHHHLSGATQSLNVLSNDMWILVVPGLAILALGTGVAALRTATLPKWLAWASVALGVLALAGPAGGIAFLVAPLWALVTGIVILRSPDPESVAAEPAVAGLRRAGV